MSTKYPDGYECRIKGGLPSETEESITIEGYQTCNGCPFYDCCELTKTGLLMTDKVFIKGCRYLEEIVRLVRVGLFKKFADIMFIVGDDGVMIKVERRREDE